MSARILIVEDNKITRKMFRVALESQGWSVTEAEDAQTAIAVVSDHLPDLVLSDLTLPDMDGAALLRRLRAIPGAAAIPCLAVSGFLSKLEQAKAHALGFAEHLFKPVDPQRLIEVVRAHIEPRGAALPGTGLRVVVADDDPIQRRLLKVQLERLGFQVQTAQSGEEALAICQVERPDALVSDVLMPRLDGFRLCHAIRSEPTLAHLPVVLVTMAFTEQDDRELAWGVGADAFVQRTPEHSAVVEALLDSLARHGAAPTVTAAPLETEAYTYRMIRQLERQVEQKADLASRLALHEAAMNVVNRIGETARSASPLGELLPELLQYALDSAGVSIGAVFLVDPRSGDVLLRAQHGFTNAAADGLARCFDRPELLAKVNQTGTALTVPAAEPPQDWERGLLTATEAGSLLLVPIGFGPTLLGVLVLVAARGRLLTDWEPFVQAIGGQIAQSVALARSEEALRRTSEQLRQSQKLEAVGRLAGGIAHDFNNLLTAITGHCELLLGQVEQDGALWDGLNQINQAGNRAAALTRQLLAFSRKQILQPKILDLNEVVEGMDRLLRRLIGADIELHTHCATDLGRVEADPSQLEQVIMNLAVNARDAMPDGGKLTLETENVVLDSATAAGLLEVAPGPYVLLAVSDTGTGMDDETLSHMFEPFFTTKEPGKGTGLGLAMVFGVVKQSGGHIAVDSEVGHGTTFKVYLPLVQGDPPAPDRAEVELATANPSVGTILVVEDDELVRELVTTVLENAGYRVFGAPEPLRALELLQDPTTEVDLLLTDLVMPTMKGNQLYRRVQPEHPDLKVLFMSGYSDQAISDNSAVEAGAQFIQKPFTPKALVRKVRELLGT